MEDVQFIEENIAVQSDSITIPLSPGLQRDCEVISINPRLEHTDLPPQHVDLHPPVVDITPSLRDLTPPPMDLTSPVCMMECGCCFSDTDFDEMVQCGDGHLFCLECLKRYAHEAIHGQGKSQLLCMTSDCGAPFPRSQMKRALSDEIIQKFDERVQEESLNMANLTNLVRCPGCNYAAEIVDENHQVFVCIKCEMRSCRHCRADWTDHEGLSCNQVEKKDETSIRTKYEERMTQARVRLCPKCKTSLVKEDGCNRVTCRCGGVICYICREPGIQYSHFCQHPGVPGASSCKKCTQCSLWTNAEADDKRLIEQLKREGKMERVTQGFNEDKDIGAPEESLQPPRVKRKRLNQNQRRQLAQKNRGVQDHVGLGNQVPNLHNNPMYLPHFGLNVNIPIHNVMHMPPPPPPGMDLLSGVNYQQQGQPNNVGQQFPHFNPADPFIKADVKAQQPPTIAHALPVHAQTAAAPTTAARAAPAPRVAAAQVTAAAAQKTAAAKRAAARQEAAQYRVDALERFMCGWNDAESTADADVQIRNAAMVATAAPATAATPRALAVDDCVKNAVIATNVPRGNALANAAGASSSAIPGGSGIGRPQAATDDCEPGNYEVSVSSGSSLKLKVFRTSPSQKRPSTSNTTTIARSSTGVQETVKSKTAVKSNSQTKGVQINSKTGMPGKGKAPAQTRARTAAQAKGKAPAQTKGKTAVLDINANDLSEQLNTLFDEEGEQLRLVEENFNQDMNRLFKKVQEERQQTTERFRRQRNDLISRFNS